MGSCISGNSITSTTTCVGFTRSCRGGKVFPSVPPCPGPSCESCWAGMGRAYTPRPRRRLPHDITYENCRGVYQQFRFWNSPSPVITYENCRGVYQQFRFWNSPSPVITALLVLSFQSLTTIKSHNSFVLLSMHVMGGVCTPPGFFSIKIRRAGVVSPAPTTRNSTTGYFPRP